MRNVEDDEKGPAPEGRGKATFLTRNGALILLSVLLNSIPIGYMNVIPAVYLLEVGYSASIVGAIYAASAFSNTVALTPFGFLADRFGRKIFLFAGSLVPAASYVIFALTLNASWLIVASVIGGVGLAGGIAVAMSGPALLPLIASSTTDKHRTTLFGATQAVWAVALTLGSILSYLPGLLIRYLGEGSLGAHAVSYYFMALLAVVSAIPVVFVREERRSREPPKGLSEEAEAAAPIIQRRSVVSWLLSLPKSTTKRIPLSSGRIVAKFSLVYALAGIGVGVIVQILASWYYLQFNIPESTAGLWIGIAEVASIPTMVAIPLLVRRHGTLSITVIFSAIATLFLGIMPLSGSFVLAAVFFILRSVFVNISWPVLQSYMMGIVREEERATTTAIATSAWGLANAVGTLVGGDLLSYDLLSLPFVIAVVGYLGSSVALWIFFRGVKPPEEEGEEKVR